MLDVLVLATLADLEGLRIARVDVLDQEAAAVGDRLDGCRVLVEDIDLLQRETLGLKEDNTSQNMYDNLTREGRN